MQIHKKRLSLKQKIRIGEKLQKVTIIRKKLRTDNKFIWKWHSKRYWLLPTVVVIFYRKECLK